mgnify:CR=1 FL=1
MKKIIIGSRGSKLALLYAHKAKECLLNNASLIADDIQIKEIVTKGDQVQDKRLSEVGGKGLFSKNIEQELLDNKIDIAVHALKDMPAIETEGLITNCFLVSFLFLVDQVQPSVTPSLNQYKIISTQNKICNIIIPSTMLRLLRQICRYLCSKPTSHVYHKFLPYLQRILRRLPKILR